VAHLSPDLGTGLGGLERLVEAEAWRFLARFYALTSTASVRHGYGKQYVKLWRVACPIYATHIGDLLMDRKLAATAAIAIASIALNIATLIALQDVRDAVPYIDEYTVRGLDERVSDLEYEVEELAGKVRRPSPW
jgi:hypothetical protein